MLSLNEVRKIAADYLGCDIDECLYIRAVGANAEMFEEPFGGWAVVDYFGNIIDHS